jgi:hypothetical protein
MYETKEQYQQIVTREVQKLEQWCHYRISPGEPGLCPRCGREGIWDIASKGFIHHMGNSIYFSTVVNEWRCGICDSHKLAGIEEPAPPICHRPREQGWH